MGIGIPAGRYGRFGVPLADKLAEPGVTQLTWDQAVAAGMPLFQGSPVAVAPMAETTTGRVAPPIPGGLQLQKVVVIVPTMPVKLPS